MSENDIKRKQLILIDYIQSLFDNFKVKAEYSTNDNDARIITIQEQTGNRIVFYDHIEPLYNYYMIDIYGLSIRECKQMALKIGNLIGNNVYLDDIIYKDGTNTYKEKWQIMFKQYTNPQPIEYMDIRRVGYNATLCCIVNKISSELILEN